MGQLHDLSGGVQGGQIDPHEGLVGCDPAAAGRVDGLEVVGHQLLLQQELKVLLGLGGVCLLMVAADIKITHAALVGMLDLIHGKVGIFFQGEQVVAVRGVPGDAARDADVQLLAVGQDGHAALQGGTQQLQLGAELCLVLVAIEEDQEFIARKAGADGVGGRVGRKALAGLADVLVAPVVAVGVVDLLEVVQIHHQQGGTAQLFGLLEQRVTGAVKGTAAVQAGQGIVIALVLNALLLQHRGGHILSKTHLGDAFAQDMGDAQGDVVGAAVGLGDGKDLVVGRGQAVEPPLLQCAHQGAESLWRERIWLLLRKAQHGEEVVGHINAVIAQLIAAQLRAGQFHNAQKAGGGVQHVFAQLGKGRGELVQLPDAGGGKMRDGGGIRFGSGYLGRELGNGPGQPPADQPAANKANGQRDQHDEGEQLLQPLGESKELHRGNGAHEKPVLARERGVPAVEVQGGDRSNVEGIAEEVAVGMGTVEAQRKAFVRRTRLPVAVGTEHRTQLQFRGRELLRIGHGKEIGAVVLQLRAGQVLPQVVGQQFHADHAVNGAVRQDQGLAVGNGLVGVPGHQIGL